MRSDSPRVTIGLPVFNAEKYLIQALDSILAQTYSDFTLIISDNASTDRTPQICEAYSAKDSRIRFYRNNKNMGAAPNFNRVFMLSSSEYFKWAPYDDVLAPDFLLKCVEVLDQNPEVSLCYSQVKVIDECGQVRYDYDPLPKTNSSKTHKRFRNLILSPHLAVQQMGLIRAEILRQTALEGSFPSSDEVLLAEIALRGVYYEIPERLYYYRLHEEQSTRGALTVQRSRTTWFDTSLAEKIVLPKWMYLFACLRAINRSPLPWYNRICCYAYMIRWVLIPPHFRALGKDALIAASKFIIRALQKPKDR
ncbi:MAG TPA: glycosyltransferase [Anaerolineae bacterium]|nr:glycosyltransferase [Anaerolineae bacterium]